ncbi:MAG: wax ester/triacylglycerol synthase family O-acyltransferase, partial [Acidimicrobiia bacterium]|nr:wax ester/triacylglycerol synthase family O-acyltransferase [Acidimicrobiia bacterium]
GTDTFFLVSERDGSPMHVGGLTLLDPTGIDGFGPDGVRALLAKRLPRAPSFLRRLHEVPFGLDCPVWVDDPDFDLDRHFHVASVPAPGGRHELAAVVGDLMGRRLDRSRPLWDIWYLEGLAAGRVGVLTRTHHAMADGVSGAGLAAALCDLEPGATTGDRRAPPPAAPEPLSEPLAPERPTDDVDLVVRGAGRALGTPVRTGQLAWQLARQGVELARFALRPEPDPTPLGILPAPSTPFNGRVGPHRAFAHASVPLGVVRDVKARHGVTVNDVVLALTADALRAYLQGIDALPHAPLVAAVPVSTRRVDDDELGNRVANMMVSLATDVADPDDRLHAIHRAASRAKELTVALQARKSLAISETAPPVVSRLLWPFLSTGMETLTLTPSNLIISNITGPTFPLYMGGARIESIIPVSALLLGMGLNVTVMSYLDVIDFGFVADAAAIPDLWALADGVPLALDALVAAGRDAP